LMPTNDFTETMLPLLWWKSKVWT